MSVDWYISQSFSRESFSGYGSTSKVQETNPFLFVIQVFLGFAAGVIGTLFKADRFLGSVPPPEIWEHDLCLHRGPDGDCVNYIPDSAALSATATSGTTTVMSVDWYISQSFSRESFSGYGSTSKMQETNPFLFVIQVFLGFAAGVIGTLFKADRFLGSVPAA
ncbi:hypothetical protein V5799_012957 [Amblyomma americanum]|uniref:Uncharacterized protein n=1 Tax=Amblyomma americanum TaxID=6943 RepID=A0AAQ4E7D8_AMBAM